VVRGHEPLICSTQLCEFTIVVYDVNIYIYIYLQHIFIYTIFSRYANDYKINQTEVEVASVYQAG